MIESPKNFIEQFQNFIEHIAGLMKTFLTKEVADNYYLGKTAKATSANTADTAIKATQDANGNVIPETYATKSELTSGLATKQPVGDYRTKSELDKIYLGINAKAKSAATADSATNADHATSADSAVNLSAGFSTISLGEPVTLSVPVNSNKTCPITGVAYTNGDPQLSRNLLVNGKHKAFANKACFVVKKGWVLYTEKTADTATTVTIYPFV